MTHIPHGGIEFEYRNLRRVLIKLDGTEGRKIARRNARTRVLASLRKLRAAIDTEYPAIVDWSEPRGRRSPKQRIRALEKAGWIQIKHGFAGYATAVVPIRHVKWNTTETSTSPSTYVRRKGWVSGTTKHVIAHDVYLVPAWAAAIGPDKPTELRAAKKSIKLRKAALVVEALR